MAIQNNIDLLNLYAYGTNGCGRIYQLCMSVVFFTRRLQSLENTADALQQIGTGDLSIRLEEDRNGKIGRINQMLNQTTGQIGNMLQSVSEHAISLSAASTPNVQILAFSLRIQPSKPMILPKWSISRPMRVSEMVQSRCSRR